MHQAMHTAATRAFTQMFLLDANETSFIHQFIELSVSRHHLVEDTIRELSHYTEDDYKKPLKVRILYLKQFRTNH